MPCQVPSPDLLRWRRGRLRGPRGWRDSLWPRTPVVAFAVVGNPDTPRPESVWFWLVKNWIGFLWRIGNLWDWSPPSPSIGLCIWMDGRFSCFCMAALAGRQTASKFTACLVFYTRVSIPYSGSTVAVAVLYNIGVVENEIARKLEHLYNKQMEFMLFASCHSIEFKSTSNQADPVPKDRALPLHGDGSHLHIHIITRRREEPCSDYFGFHLIDIDIYIYSYAVAPRRVHNMHRAPYGYIHTVTQVTDRDWIIHLSAALQ